MSTSKSTIQFRGHAPVSIPDDDVAVFLRGEIPPLVADRFLHAGMLRRGLCVFMLTVPTSHGGTRVIGPSLCRRAGTASSAKEAA